MACGTRGGTVAAAATVTGASTTAKMATGIPEVRAVRNGALETGPEPRVQDLNPGFGT